MRRKIVAGNWKMNKTPTEAKTLALEIAKALGFQTHSAVLKRIRKIGKAYERFAGEDYGFSEAKII